MIVEEHSKSSFMLVSFMQIQFTLQVKMDSFVYFLFKQNHFLNRTRQKLVTPSLSIPLSTWRVSEYTPGVAMREKVRKNFTQRNRNTEA